MNKKTYSKLGLLITSFVIAFTSCGIPNSNISDSKDAYKSKNVEYKPSNNVIENKIKSDLLKIYPNKKIYFLSDLKFRTKVTSGTGCDRFYVRVFNTDDTGYVYINLNQALVALYSLDSGLVDVTDFMSLYSNTVNFQVYNGASGYTWGFLFYRNSDPIFYDSQGQSGYLGANGNDHSREFQIVYNKSINVINSCAQNSSHTPVCTTEFDSNNSPYQNCFSCPQGMSVLMENGVPSGCVPQDNVGEDVYSQGDDHLYSFGTDGPFKIQSFGYDNNCNTPN